MKNHLFPSESQKTIFLVSGRIVSQKMVWVFLVFPRKKLVFLSRTIFFLSKFGFPVQNHLFPRKKLVFLSKTIFFLGKTKKTIFLVSGRIVSQKMVFLVFLPKTIFFLGKSWFFTPKPPFSLRNLGISLQDQAFPSKECAFHVLFARVTN